MPPKSKAKKTAPKRASTRQQRTVQEEQKKEEKQQAPEQEPEGASAAIMAAARGGVLEWNKSWAHINKTAIKPLTRILDGGLEASPSRPLPCLPAFSLRRVLCAWRGRAGGGRTIGIH